MAKINISLSMPYLLEGTYTPDWAITLEVNIEHLEQLHKRHPKRIADYHMPMSKKVFPLMYCRYKNLDVYYVEQFNRIQYCVEVEHYETNGLVELHTLSQTSVWRNKNYGDLFGIAKWVFDTILMPKNKNIMSDSIQSADGKNFWGRRIMEALMEHKHVYALWLYGASTLEVLQLEPLTSLDNLDDYYTTKDDLSGKYWRFIISDKDLE